MACPWDCNSHLDTRGGLLNTFRSLLATRPLLRLCSSFLFHITWHRKPLVQIDACYAKPQFGHSLCTKFCVSPEVLRYVNKMTLQ